MKKIFTLIAILVSFSVSAQQANKLLQGQSKPYTQGSANNYLWVDTTDFKIWAANIDSLKLKIWNMLWVMDSVRNFGDRRYAQLLGAYSNPAFVNSLAASKVFGLSTVATTGAYSDLSGTPNLALYYLASNPNGYINGVTSGMIIAALGYNPYNGTLNPNNYVTSAVLSSNLASYLLKSDSTNGYTPKYRIDTLALNVYLALTAKQAQINGTGFVKANGTTITFDNSTYATTSSLLANLLKGDSTIFVPKYRVDSLTASVYVALATKFNSSGFTVTAINSLYGKTLFGFPDTTTLGLIARFAGKEPTITSGTTAQYWRGDKSWQTLNTAAVPESGSLYYTDTRARAALSAGTGITYNSITGVISSAIVAPTFNNSPSRTLNTSYQVSTTNNSRVSYSVSCATGLALLNLNSTAQVFLEISANNSTWTTIAGGGSTQTLAVAISVGINTTQIQNLQCEVPAGYWVRLRTVTAGGGTTTFSSGQEVIY